MDREHILSEQPYGTPCSCVGPGYCIRHLKRKGPSNFKLCQTRDDYRDKWDADAILARKEYIAAEAEQAEKLEEEALLAAAKLAEQQAEEEVVAEVDVPEEEEWDVSKPSRGLGDLVKKGLTRIGITEELVKSVTGKKDCGCGKRQSALNKLVPFGKKDK
jgi:hypothetical protein